MRLATALLVVGTGCAQIFGIDDTTRGDAGDNFPSVEIQRVSIGATVTKTPQDLSAQTATFFNPDGSPVPGMLDGTNRFVADVLGTPPVVVTVPDGLVPRRMYAMPSRDQKANFNVFEHPNAQPPLPSSQIALAVTLPSAVATGETFVLSSIGAWMTHSVPATDAATSISTTLNYSTFTSMVGKAKARITAADVTLLLRYAGTQLTGVLQSQFDQTDGADSVTGTLTAVTPDKSMTGTVATDIATRITAARPTLGTPSMSWRVSAAPGWSFGSDVGVQLLSGTYTADPLTGSFANPFESLDWKAVFTFSASASRSYMYTENAMMASTTLGAFLGQSLAAPTGAFNVALSAGLPTTIRANQMLLTTDDMTLPLDLTAPVTIDAIVDKSTATAYEMSLVQLGLDTTGSAPVVTRTTVLDAFTTGTPTFRIPGELLTLGKSYYITVRCYDGGYTGAATGDLQTVSLPFSSGSLDSAVFVVGAP